MPATSKSQQRLFGMTHAIQNGSFKGKPSAKLKGLAKRVDKTSVRHFAETKHEGLPEKSAAALRRLAGEAALDGLLKRAFPASGPLARITLARTIIKAAVAVKAADDMGAMSTGMSPGVGAGMGGGMGAGMDTGMTAAPMAAATTSPQTFTGPPNTGGFAAVM